MRDEEDLMNSPADEPAQEPEGGESSGGREASPQEQKMFDTLARQALKMLLTDDATEMIIAGAKAKGGEQAIADAVTQVLQVAVQAAASAGVQVPADVLHAAAQPPVQVLCKVAEQAGFVQDADQAAGQVLDMVDQAMTGGQAEPDADDAGGPPDGDADDGAAPSDREEF